MEFYLKRSGLIEAPIKRKADSIIERQVSSDGEPAVTHYEVIKEFNSYSIVKFVLETGRTHQIRVHSAFIGHPIIGDTLYGSKSDLIDRQALHAFKIKFLHPICKRVIEINAPIPDDMAKCIDLKTKK